RAVVLACVIASAACSSSTSPSAPQEALNYAGIWVGTHTVTSIRGGADLRAASRFPHNGKLKLTLMQSGITVSGMMVIDGPVPSSEATGRFTSHTVPVTGDIDTSGALSLKGSLEFVDPANLPYITALSSVRLLDWHSARVVDVMVGHLHSTVSGF